MALLAHNALADIPPHMHPPPSSLTQSLKQRLQAGFPDLKLAILFGSVSTGKARRDSDLDLAVSFDHALSAQTKMALISELAALTGRPVDLVDLATAGEPLLGQILAHGRLILGEKSQLAQLIYRHVIEEADFLPYKNRILAERRQAWIGK